MARRRSSLDDLVELLMLLPWWVSAALAPISYWILTQYAAHAELENPFIQMMVRAVASIAPFIAAGFLLVAVAILFKQWHRQRLLEKQQGIETIRGLTWREFEWLIGEAFRRQGYRITESAPGPDDGVDLVLVKDGQKTLVQCKHWKRTKVSVAPIRELLGTIHAKGASGGIFVCSGEFTKPAADFARENGIWLIDGVALEVLIRDVKKESVVPPLAESSGAISSGQPNQASGPEKPVPLCPKCGSVMAQRYSRRGENPGTPFWGCTTFPRCRGTLAFSLGERN